MTFKSPFLKEALILLILTLNPTNIQGFRSSETLKIADSEDITISSVVLYSQPFEMDGDRVKESEHLKDFYNEIDSIIHSCTIYHVNVTGIASIDGSEPYNKKLSLARAEAMAKWLTSTSPIPASIISIESRGADWHLFHSLVEANTNIPGRQKILDIIASGNTEAQKENELRQVDEGKTWSYLAKNIFPLMRCAEVKLDVKRNYKVTKIEELAEIEDNKAVNISEPETINEDIEQPILPEITEDDWRRQFYIKTDLPYWLLSWSNIAFEVDIAKHWSFNLPIYFSAVNYFKRDLKFRVFGFQPGFRYWFKPDNKGAFLEAHYGMAWYDFAFGGKYRYQDAWRNTPAIGGGLSAGYRLPISKNGHWSMEFGGGIGVYRLKYNRFFNEKNGKLIDTKQKTYFGIDNINVSISYSFPIEKKKGGGQ